MLFWANVCTVSHILLCLEKINIIGGILDKSSDVSGCSRSQQIVCLPSNAPKANQKVAELNSRMSGELIVFLDTNRGINNA